MCVSSILIQDSPVEDMTHEVLSIFNRTADEAKEVMSQLEPPATGN